MTKIKETSTKINPCPFCGSKAKCIKGEGGGYFIECVLCNACIGYIGYGGLDIYEESFGTFKTQEDAIETWNTRK